MAMIERSPQLVLETQEQAEKDSIGMLLPQSGFYEGLYGHLPMVFVAVKTNAHKLHEARVAVKTSEPYELADAFAAAFQQVLTPDFPQIREVSIGNIGFGIIGNNGSMEVSATVQMIRNGDVTARLATGKTREQALMNAIFEGFKGMVQR